MFRLDYVDDKILWNRIIRPNPNMGTDQYLYSVEHIKHSVNTV